MLQYFWCVFMEVVRGKEKIYCNSPGWGDPRDHGSTSSTEAVPIRETNQLPPKPRTRWAPRDPIRRQQNVDKQEYFIAQQNEKVSTNLREDEAVAGGVTWVRDFVLHRVEEQHRDDLCHRRA